jgi:hypothetical protein
MKTKRTPHSRELAVQLLTTQKSIGESNGSARAARKSELVVSTYEEKFPRIVATPHFRWL